MPGKLLRLQRLLFLPQHSPSWLTPAAADMRAPLSLFAAGIHGESAGRTGPGAQLLLQHTLSQPLP